MKRTKKRLIPMKTRRMIFFVVCGFLLGTLVTSCAYKITDKTDETPIIEANAAVATPLVFKETYNYSENTRYSEISISREEMDEMAAIIYLEARNQSAKGQQAVAEVILNRVLNDGFPDTVRDVIHEGEEKGIVQFTTVYALDEAEPSAEQYAAIDNALYGKSVLPVEVVFFSRNGENDRVWGKIEDHVFCYGYDWE